MKRTIARLLRNYREWRIVNTKRRYGMAIRSMYRFNDLVTVKMGCVDSECRVIYADMSHPGRLRVMPVGQHNGKGVMVYVENVRHMGK